MSTKQISVKQAQKWLDKLKSEDNQAYKEITRHLRRYEKNQDQYDCFIKINQTLLNHIKLTQQLNTFMQQGNKLIINRTQSQKIKQLMSFMKKNRPEIFSKIINVITQMSTKNIVDSQEMNRQLKIHILDIIKHDNQLKKITQEALQLTGEQLIERLQLEHLKGNGIKNQIGQGNNQVMVDEIEEEMSKQQNNNKTIQRGINKKQPQSTSKAIIQKQKQPIISQPQPKPQRVFPFTTIASVDDQKLIFKQLQKVLQRRVYLQVIKILRVYYLNIITRNQVFELLNSFTQFQQQLQFLKDIIQTRETDRRRLSIFKPLNDLDFTTSNRPSPSYVLMPTSYPNICHGRNISPFFKAIMNTVYVSVPHGSEQNFNVRFKNANQVNLLKSEDERYQFDLYMMRLNKADKMLAKVLESFNCNNNNTNNNNGINNNNKNIMKQQQIKDYIEKIISMGIIQLIYKNCNKQQKEELEWHMKTNQVQMLTILKDRIHFQIKQMQSIKAIHALRAWEDVANRNFSKALDLKGFQFKKNQKQKIKGAAFISQLHERAASLQNGGHAKLNLLIPFQDRKQFFTIFNSFQVSSRTQKCQHRQLPQIKLYDLHDQQNRKFYPVMIMSFENKGICQKIYSLIHFYIDSYSMSDSEKIRCKLFLENLLVGFMGWDVPVKRYLNQLFDEEKLYLEINNSLQQHLDLTEWISEMKQQRMNPNQSQQQLPQLNTLPQSNDIYSSYLYFPQKSPNNKILYGSQQLYALLRFIYTFYQRIIKMQQISQYQQKIILFQILFYSCVKAKQGIKFQQNLNIIFGKHAYLFSTIYKLCDNLIRTLSSVSTCIITTQSLRLSKIKSQQLYLLLLNKFCLSNQLANNKLIRLVYQSQSTVSYINVLESFYKAQDNSKDLIKKRVQITRGIDIYMVDAWYGNQIHKKRKLNQIVQKNNQEYLFLSSTIKMVNHKQNQDILCFVGKVSSFVKNLKREMKRITKINQKLH